MEVEGSQSYPITNYSSNKIKILSNNKRIIQIITHRGDRFISVSSSCRFYWRQSEIKAGKHEFTAEIPWK